VANSAAWNLATVVGARRGVAKAGWNLAQFRAVLVLIETVGADQMELGSSSAQGVKRLNKAGRFRGQEGNPKM